jgi:hypothetical protein
MEEEVAGEHAGGGPRRAWLIAGGSGGKVEEKSHLARFFWEGVGGKLKFHWVKWPDVC